ncbi:helix-turn-helix domain-containing protein [Streptomyces sp. NPDC090298]|uniref:helix-turn-helix domain-containing protein n=1 Tax=Streptomyces sp. NPDC090298 TaxID=3365959 RepID=UPI00382C8234
MPGPGNPYATSDLGRRVAARRALLGLSREEVAERAGSTSGYIAYVEERVSTPGAEFLVRLASALETTVQDLAGYTADLPQAGPRPGADREWRRSTKRSAGGCSTTTASAASRSKARTDRRSSR